MTMKSIAVALLAGLMLTGCYDYSDGSRVGVVQKFSYKGLLCKTWEGEMALPGFRMDKDGTGNIFEFTVEDQSFIPAVTAALNSGKTVRLTYRQEFIASPCRTSSDGDYFITAVSAQ